MNRYLVILLLILVGCSNIPQSGNVSASCSYIINDNKSVTLNCIPVMPATYTPSPTSAASTSTNISPTPTAVTSTVTPSPTGLPRAGFPTQAVVRNGSTTQVRVRDCRNMSDINPFLCPQAKVNGLNAAGNMVLVDFYITPNTAFRLWRVHRPQNNNRYVWGSFSSDASVNHYWTAICYNSVALLDAYNMNGYTPVQDILTIWWELYQNGQAPVPQSCTYPEG